MAAANGSDSEPEVSSRDDEWKAFREQQDQIPALTPAEWCRAVIQTRRSCIIANISTQKGVESFPRTSYVDYVCDDNGQPLFGMSTLSPRTREILQDGRCSMIVMENDVLERSNQKVSLVGNIKLLEGEDAAKAKKVYLSKQPDAFWVNFGDFGIYQMQEIKDVQFIVDIGLGTARAGNVKVEDYCAASEDPVFPFTAPISKHLNSDHGDTLPVLIKHYTGVDVDNTEMYRLDRFGFDLVCKNKQFGNFIVRLEYPRPVTDRKDVRTAIVQMCEAATKNGAESP